MNNPIPLILILLLSSLAFPDIIAFRDGVSDNVKIQDTAGCSVQIIRDGAPFTIAKEKLGFIVFNQDTVIYETFVCTEARRNAEKAALPARPDTSPGFNGRTGLETGDRNGAIRLTKTTEIGYSAPMMGANGMMMGGGMPYPKSVDCFEVFGDNIRVGYFGQSLKPFLNPKSDALKYLGYFQGQKIGAIGCYAGSVVCLLVAIFAGQEDNGTSYGYNAQTDSWGEQHNSKINAIWAPTMVSGGICLITGLILQFTAHEQLVKAVKVHNESILKDGSK